VKVGKQFELNRSTKKVVINHIVWGLETEFVKFQISFDESGNYKLERFEFAPQT
jgi:hypothetical protein